MVKGSGFKGTEDLVTTATVNEEVVPTKPEDWSFGYEFYKFSFVNKTACHVVVNGKHRLFLDVEQGFESTERDVPITSFVIEESGVQYQFIACY